MSRTIKTKSGSDFITSINTERFIAILCKEVGAKYEEDHRDFSPIMAYEMNEEETKDVVYKLTEFLSKERYFRFFNKIKIQVFDKDATIETFISAVESVINDFRQSGGYECIY